MNRKTNKKTINRIEDLIPDPRNPNEGTERGRAVLEHSLGQYGAGRSILAAADGTVLAGNKTLEVAGELGLPVRVVETDGRELVVVQRTDLDPNDPRARALAIADNRASELGLSWSAQLIEQVNEGLDVGAMFAPGELALLSARMEAGESPVQNTLRPVDRAGDLDPLELPDSQGDIINPAVSRAYVLYVSFRSREELVEAASLLTGTQHKLPQSALLTSISAYPDKGMPLLEYWRTVFGARAESANG